MTSFAIYDMIKPLFILLLLTCQACYAQLKTFKNNELIPFDGKQEFNYDLPFQLHTSYLIKVYQENVDVELNLYDANGQKLASTDLADGNKGYDKLEYAAEKSGKYRLNIRSVSTGPVSNGMIKISVNALSKPEIMRRQRIASELVPENAKDVTTIDIKHFWEAFDQLKTGKTFDDSVRIIQTVYLDRATNGLKEFARVRYFSAEFYVERIKKYKKFYESVRENTLSFLDTKDLSGIIERTRSMYADGKLAKVAITMGPMSSGGTLSDNYVLIGIEMLAGDRNCDVSEITNENLKTDILARSGQTDVLNFVKETIAHEYIHTQQKSISKEACQCILLENVIKEGVASFISESLIMKRTKETGSRAAQYATAHEKELWQELKSELCTKDLQHWLFNAATSNERPGDLGYRIGYKIAESYYNSALDKNMAIREMIRMDDALLFLDKSRYDLKLR